MERSGWYHVQRDHLNDIERKASLGNNLSGLVFFFLMAAQSDTALQEKLKSAMEAGINGDSGIRIL